MLLAATLCGFVVFAARQALGGWMLAGLVAYGTGFVANLFAGTINGFIVPAVADRVDHAASGDLFVLLWQSNQAAANLGVYATSAALFTGAITLDVTGAMIAYSVHAAWTGRV